jgi:hypothetical protein
MRVAVEVVIRMMLAPVPTLGYTNGP